MFPDFLRQDHRGSCSILGKKNEKLQKPSNVSDSNLHVGSWDGRVVATPTTLRSLRQTDQKPGKRKNWPEEERSGRSETSPVPTTAGMTVDSLAGEDGKDVVRTRTASWGCDAALVETWETTNTWQMKPAAKKTRLFSSHSFRFIASQLSFSWVCAVLLPGENYLELWSWRWRHWESLKQEEAATLTLTRAPSRLRRLPARF